MARNDNNAWQSNVSRVMCLYYSLGNDGGSDLEIAIKVVVLPSERSKARRGASHAKSQEAF
jgi:hypothetical protein